MDEQINQNILKTGTSLVGIVCKEGVVVAGDRKVTLGGRIVADKNTQKVEKINDYLIIAGTGIASDIEIAKKIIRTELKLKELRDKKRPSVKEAANLVSFFLYRNIRQPSMIVFTAGLLVGGLNKDGNAELYSVSPDGAVKKVEDYDANFSSGMPYILGLLERQYRPNISIKEGVALAIEAIKSSSERDTASGYGIDVMTITKEGIKHVVKQKAKVDYKEED